MISLKFNQNEKIPFYWQQDYEKYKNQCAKRTLLKVFDWLDINWVKINQNRAEVRIVPPPDGIYSVALSLHIVYRNELRKLPLVVN